MKQYSKKGHYKLKLEKTRMAKSAKRKKRIKEKIRHEEAACYAIDLSFINKVTSPAGIFVLIFLFFLLSPLSEIVRNPLVLQAEADTGMSDGKSYDHFFSYPYSDNSQAFGIERNEELYQEITPILVDTPMGAMINEIAKRDRAVAAFLVGIAMKESKFGKYSPKKDGNECYNYWGYRGKENTTASGYSCFDDPAHAIKVVGDRIETLVKKGSKTPAQMISWKCGRSCAGHSPESVDKWIKDVGIYYFRLNPAKEMAKK